MKDIGQYLTVTLGKEFFALDVESVREILEITAVTRVPRTPEHMRGVINLRGNAVPVVDLRKKLGLDPTPDTVDTCIIIVEVEEDGESSILGAVVDSVREVSEIASENIEDPPSMGSVVESEYILGMTRQDDRFIILFDIARVFCAKGLCLGRETAAVD